MAHIGDNIMKNFRLAKEDLAGKIGEEFLNTANLPTQATDGQVYIKVHTETSPIEAAYWALEADVIAHNEQYAPVVEESSSESFFDSPVTATSVDVEFQTIGSRIETTQETLTASDVASYLTQGTLTAAETSTPIRSFTELATLDSDTEGKVKVLYIRNKTGN